MSDLESWVAEIRELEATDPPDLFASKGVIPMDPLDEDRLPPEDRFVCPLCEGTGSITEYDGPERDPASASGDVCDACDGSGVILS